MLNRDIIEANSVIYSERFGLDNGKDAFPWFLLSVLFGARISENIAVRTFVVFRSEGILTPHAIIDCGFDRLVSLLDSGGYARYDFRTAVKLEEMSRSILKEGGLEMIHGLSSGGEDLVQRLKALARGIGNVTVGIFLREMAGTWRKAVPLPSPLVRDGAEFLGVELSDYVKFGISYAQFESFLVKVGRDCVRSRKKSGSGFCAVLKE